MDTAKSLEDALREHERLGALWEPLGRDQVRCFACGHECRVQEGTAGLCGVRRNRGGQLFVPWGYVAGALLEPIEKKPFFHVLPGARTYSFGMLGCDMRCPYCQNWRMSQAHRDPEAGVPLRLVSPELLVQQAVGRGAAVLVSTYNEPLLTAEWAVEIFREARAAGLLTAFVSNGNATPQALEYIRPWVDLYKVDLKSADERTYSRLGGRLERVLDSLRRIYALGFWLEVVTLVVPGLNDSDEELRRAADQLAEISSDIPWHVTAFHRDYRMLDPADTGSEALLRAVEIGRAAGLRHVYAGNLAGRVRDAENTRCAGCGEFLVERYGFRTVTCKIDLDGCCPYCARPVPGIWTSPAGRSI